MRSGLRWVDGSVSSGWHGGLHLPRDIPVGNGEMLVTFDQHYQIRDFYFPHVGQENHAGAGPCRFGVWSNLPKAHENHGDRRRKRLFWTYQNWEIDLGYQPDTLATNVVMKHRDLQLEMRCSDVVDFHRLMLVRKIEITNQVDQDREVHLFHHNDFMMYGTRVGDTAMAIGLFMLFREFGTLDIQAILHAAPVHLAGHPQLTTAIALLLLGGAVGKSAQLPLQT